MNKPLSIIIVLGLATAVGLVLVLKNTANPADGPGDPQGGAGSATREALVSAALPRLVDLGAGKCIPCKMMKPELDALKSEYSGRLQVDVYDVWKDRAKGDQFGIRIIPTQIFFDADGRELFRHEGFMSKKDMVEKFRELGVPLASPAP